MFRKEAEQFLRVKVIAGPFNVKPHSGRPNSTVNYKNVQAVENFVM